MQKRYKTVPDTNIIVAAYKTTNLNSPNKEYRDLWLQDRLDLLYSQDTQQEYLEKLLDRGIPKDVIKQFVFALRRLGKNIEIEKYHFLKYPSDPDDIAFVLCADNGEATHLISYDHHLLEIKYKYSFKICKITEFLHEFRSQKQ